jgi:hypothetical protein
MVLSVYPYGSRAWPVTAERTATPTGVRRPIFRVLPSSGRNSPPHRRHGHPVASGRCRAIAACSYTSPQDTHLNRGTR